MSAILWFAPLALGVILLVDTDRRAAYLAAISRFTRGALVVLGAYALAQWTWASEWDSFWFLAVTPTADMFGRPRPER